MTKCFREKNECVNRHGECLKHEIHSELLDFVVQMTGMVIIKVIIDVYNLSPTNDN